jgi:hypothetical protein
MKKAEKLNADSDKNNQIEHKHVENKVSWKQFKMMSK